MNLHLLIQQAQQLHKYMTTIQLRDAYLNFFKDRGHAIIPSASLLPENDPTTLFTGSGMQPMVPYLLGQPHPLGTRISDSQKSFRSQDIEEVGDNRHTTFFEMLGNWSLGDYFKKEQIEWMYEFLTKTVGLNPNRLYITCFRGLDSIPKDEEAAGYWQAQFAKDGIEAPIVDFPEENGMGDGRIFYYNEKKNWWSRAGVPNNMPVGEPGGPDTEMFWDFGAQMGLHEQSQWKDEPCHVNCDCGRFMEIGNNVFMQYQKTADGFIELPQRNVDFGGGLERIAAALFDTPDVFKIDLFDTMREALETASGKKYGENTKETYAFRVILDHIRASTFLISDNALPSNKDQGYFTRRMIRRAVRFGRDLGINTNFITPITDAVISTYEGQYPELREKAEIIKAEIEKEETKFRRTLEAGMKQFEIVIEKVGESKQISGVDAFDLLQSFGFPIEVTQELATERGLTIDMAVFAAEKQRHQELSRTASEGKFKGGLADASEATTKLHTAHHLLLKALQIVLGPHVKQRGSNITAERLRIDFVHNDKMTDEQKQEVERIVNEQIALDLPMTRSIIPKEQAEQLGAEHEFGAKYPDMVSVYSLGPKGATVENPQFENAFSIEFCGGPHVERTGNLGTFKILKEEASSAGVRRIKAILE